MAGLDAFGTILAKESATPGTYTAIANVSGLSGPGLSRETLDVTAHDSPDAYREFLGGLRDPGEISADLNYDPAAHDTLIEDLDDDDPSNYRITWPDGTTWTFPAIMTGFEPSAPIDDKLAASVTWKVSGKPVRVPAA
jgi:predicted secreted protein